MNKKIATLCTLLLSAPLLYAGGDIGNPEEIKLDIGNVNYSTLSSNYFYTGLGYSFMKKENTSDERKDRQVTAHGLNLQLGYKFHSNLAVELRAISNTGKARAHNANQDWDLANVALYIKPQHTFNDLTVYGLLGYGATRFKATETHTVDGIQYGVGASFALTESLDAYADYTHLYDSTGFDDIDLKDDVSMFSLNVGLTYKF